MTIELAEVTAEKPKYDLGWYLSAILEDPHEQEEFKLEISKWFESCENDKKRIAELEETVGKYKEMRQLTVDRHKSAMENLTRFHHLELDHLSKSHKRDLKILNSLLLLMFALLIGKDVVRWLYG